MLIYPTVKMRPLLGLLGTGGGSGGAGTYSGGSLIKAPFDYAFSFDGGSATLGLQDGSAQSTLTETGGNPLNDWQSTGGLNNTGHYASSTGTSDANIWSFPSSNSVEGNAINGDVGDFDQYALSCWVKTTLNDSAGNYTVYETILGDTTGSVWGGFGVDDGKATMAQAAAKWTSTSNVNTGSWVHIGFIVEPTTLRIFVNGVKETTQTGITWSTNLHFWNFCGTYNYGNKKIANLDAVVIWIDRDISDDDMTNAYTAGAFSGI